MAQASVNGLSLRLADVQPAGPCFRDLFLKSGRHLDDCTRDRCRAWTMPLTNRGRNGLDSHGANRSLGGDFNRLDVTQQVIRGVWAAVDLTLRVHGTSVRRQAMMIIDMVPHEMIHFMHT